MGTGSLRMGDVMKPWTLIVLIAATGGCSVLVDDAIRDPADGGTTGSCEGAADGTPCSGERICVEGECTVSRCGDALTDPSADEDCDDGNDAPGDGCENDCSFSCADASDCDDGLPCTGVEVCSASHVCEPGTMLAQGEACTQEDATPGECNGSVCVAAGCGNGSTVGTEECDDGNIVDGDGCDGDCTFSCVIDADCDDASVCTGTETCDVATHTCNPGTAMACDDGDVCTSNECDATSGCVYPLIDADGDGHASQTLGACGRDCNDMRADVSPDAVELCEDALDSDCNGQNDPLTTPFWYLDCDGDGFAARTAAMGPQRCSEPAPQSGCPGGWTTRVPVSTNRATYDCNDAAGVVFPGQHNYYASPISGASSSIDYDYDCDLEEEPDLTARLVTDRAPCSGTGTRCTGVSGWTGTAVPACGATATASICAAPLGVACARTTRSSFYQRCQ